MQSVEKALAFVESEESPVISYLTGDLTTWGSAKRAELKDRVTHA